MPEVTIHIGGRGFEVSCQDGEQSYLHSAAKMLDDEAQVLSDQIGRMPEARMLLMAGLLLADKTAAVEDKIKVVEAQLAEKDAEIGAQVAEQEAQVAAQLAEKDAQMAALQAELAELKAAPPPEPERIEIPFVPPQVSEALTDLAAKTETLAQEIETKVAG